MQRIQDNYTLTSRASELDTQSQDAVVERAFKVLMVGSHPEKTLGGISTVINALLCSPTMAEFDIRFIGSQADDYGAFSKLILAALSLVIFVFQILWWRPQMAYIHVGSNASLYRKVPFLALARWLKLRVIAHFHAGDFTHYYSKQSGVGQNLIRYGLGRSHRIIAVSRASQDVLRELLPNAKVSYLPNGIDLSAFAGKKEKTDETVRLLFVGAMGKLKGERDLIQAISTVAKDNRNLKVML
ncbi:MAG TPA: glycosyltransferase, partial [Blastocatellia bacterium]|nr:glycosyltransferase [Blastocatellia bacterium]